MIRPATTVAESLYPTSGILDTTYDEYISIRNAKNETKKVFYDQIANMTIDTEIVSLELLEIQILQRLFQVIGSIVSVVL